MPKIFVSLMIALMLFVPNRLAQDRDAEQRDRFLLLATKRTGTMEKELNEAGARGYRVVGAQSGGTSFGGDEVVVIMTQDPEGRRFSYKLLATSRTGTMQEEMNKLPREYEFVAMTVFERGGLPGLRGNETAAIFEAEINEE